MTELPENIQEAIREFAGATASVAGILMLSLDHEVNHDAIHREIERLAVANDVLEKSILDAINTQEQPPAMFNIDPPIDPGYV